MNFTSFNKDYILDKNGEKKYNVTILNASVGEYCLYNDKIWYITSFYQGKFTLERQKRGEKVIVSPIKTKEKLVLIANSGYIPL